MQYISHEHTPAENSSLKSAYDGTLNAVSVALQRAASAMDASVASSLNGGPVISAMDQDVVQLK